MSESKKRPREYRIHFIDAGDSNAPNFIRIGKDNDNITRVTNHTTNMLKNVIGEMQTSTIRDNDEIDVDPFYVRKNEPLGILLQDIDAGHLELDALKRDYIEALPTEDELETGIASNAFRQTVDIVPVSVGGPSNAGDKISFRLAFSGKKVQGTFDLNTKTFIQRGMLVFLDADGNEFHDAAGKRFLVRG